MANDLGSDDYATETTDDPTRRWLEPEEALCADIPGIRVRVCERDGLVELRAVKKTRYETPDGRMKSARSTVAVAKESWHEAGKFLLFFRNPGCSKLVYDSDDLAGIRMYDGWWAADDRPAAYLGWRIGKDISAGKYVQPVDQAFLDDLRRRMPDR